MVDRRRHHRYAASGPAAVTVLREVDIEAASETRLIVISGDPAAVGSPARIRVAAAAHPPVTLRARVMRCSTVSSDDVRRFRVTYAVLGVEEAARA